VEVYNDNADYIMCRWLLKKIIFLPQEHSPE